MSTVDFTGMDDIQLGRKVMSIMQAAEAMALAWPVLNELLFPLRSHYKNFYVVPKPRGKLPSQARLVAAIKINNLVQEMGKLIPAHEEIVVVETKEEDHEESVG